MTNQSEKFCLKWKEYHKNISSSYQELRQQPDISDVTLVCEEDQSVEAHRIILTACSPFFSSILTKNKHSHPMIYMRGLKAKDLVAIVDFVYLGEANIFQEDLNDFLALADELQIKGLTGSQSKKEEDIENHVRPKQKKQNNPKPKEIPHSKQISEQNHKTSDIFGQENQSLTPLDEEKVGSTSEIEITELKARLDSMIERASHQDYKFQCNVCGKTSTNNQTMTRHVETHIEGLSYPCNQCGKVSRSSHGLQVDNTREHRK